MRARLHCSAPAACPSTNRASPKSSKKPSPQGASASLQALTRQQNSATSISSASAHRKRRTRQPQTSPMWTPLSAPSPPALPARRCSSASPPSPLAPPPACPRWSRSYHRSVPSSNSLGTRSSFAKVLQSRTRSTPTAWYSGSTRAGLKHSCVRRSNRS